AVTSGKAGILETTVDGHKEVVSYAPIGIGGWVATTHQEASEFYGPLQSGRRNIDRALAAVLVAAAVALIVVGYKRQSTARRDEAALRRSEERFRSLARNAFDVVTVFSADGVILYDSPAIERVLGYAHEDRLGDNVL